MRTVITNSKGTLSYRVADGADKDKLFMYREENPYHPDTSVVPLSFGTVWSAMEWVRSTGRDPKWYRYSDHPGME